YVSLVSNPFVFLVYFAVSALRAFLCLFVATFDFVSGQQISVNQRFISGFESFRVFSVFRGSPLRLCVFAFKIQVLMTRSIFHLFPVVACALPCAAQWQYPATKTVDVEDTYFGKTYKDPYRWLENMKDKEVEAWFKAQADLTDAQLAKIPG